MRRLGLALGLVAIVLGGAGSAQAETRIVVQSSTNHYVPDIPFSGPLNSVAVSSDNPQAIAVASETGGLFTSYDGGVSWSRDDRLGSTRVRDVRWLDRADFGCSCLLATTGTDFEAGGNGGLSIYRPGAGWSRAAGVLPPTGRRCAPEPAAHGIATDPGGGEIYVATDCGVAIGDSHLNFSNVDVGAGAPGFVAIAALGSDHVIAGGYSGIYYTTNNGGIWHAGTGPAAVTQLHAIGADPVTAGRAYVLDDLNHLWQTDNWGQNWTQVPGTFADPTSSSFGCGGINNVHATAFGGRLHLYVGDRCTTYQASVATQQSPATTLTTGSWTALAPTHPNTDTREHGDTRDLALDPRTGKPWLITSDGGIEQGADGTGFHMIGGPAAGLDANQVTEVTGQFFGSSLDPDLYFATQHDNLWSMAGDSPRVNNTFFFEGFGFGMARHVPDTSSPDRIIFASCWGCGNHVSDAHFAHPIDFPNAEPNVGGPTRVGTNSYVEAVDSSNTRTHASGLQYTRNEGHDWRQIANFRAVGSGAFASSVGVFGAPQVAGPASNPTIFQAYPEFLPGGDQATVKLARVTDFSGATGSHLEYAEMAGARRRDGTFYPDFGSLGVTETDWDWYEVFGVDPSDPARIIAPDVTTNQIRRSTDGGNTWSDLPGLEDMITHHGLYVDSVPQGNRRHPIASVVSICPDDGSRVLIGTRQGGLWFSYDGGDHWVQIQGSAPIVFATSVFWTLGCGGAYVSSYGRGVWHVGMLVRTETVFPSHPCAPAVCRLRDIVTHYLLKHHAGPSAVHGVLISDGFITAVSRSGETRILHVTPGSAISYYRSARGFKVVHSRGMPSRQGQLHGLFVTRAGKLLRMRVQGGLALVALKRGHVAPGAKQPLGDRRAELDISAPQFANGTQTAILHIGQPLNVHIRVSPVVKETLELLVDGHVVAKFASGSTNLTFGSKQGLSTLGTHVISLVGRAGKTLDHLGSVDVLVPHMDGAEK